MGCQNGIYYVKIKNFADLEPLGFEAPYQKLQVFWLSPALDNSAFVAITSSVGESETHESVGFSMFLRSKSSTTKARVKQIMVVRTTVQQQSQFQIYSVPNRVDERFMLTVVTPWLRLIDIARAKVYTLGEIPNFSQTAERSFSLKQINDKISLLCLTSVGTLSVLNVYELPLRFSSDLEEWIEGEEANQMFQNSERVLA